jgi:hypothetical protein
MHTTRRAIKLKKVTKKRAKNQVYRESRQYKYNIREKNVPTPAGVIMAGGEIGARLST